MPDRYLAC